MKSAQSNYRIICHKLCYVLWHNCKSFYWNIFGSKPLNLICIQDSDGEKCKVLFLYIKFGVKDQIEQKNCLADSIANI